MTTALETAPTSAHAAARLVAQERHRRTRRRSAIAAVLFVLVAGGGAASLMFGTFTIPLVDVLPGLFGEGRRGTVFVLQTLRLPRTAAAILVGAALAVSGSIFQTITRNPLATPDILGITGTASLGAAWAILGERANGTSVALIAGLAGASAAVLIYLLAWRRGAQGQRLILVGIGIAALAAAGTSWLLTQRQALEAQRAMIWIAGSINNVSPPELWCLVVVCAGAAVLLPLVRRWLPLLELGDETATGLGLHPERARLVAIAVAVALGAAAVAVAGPVAFVALVAAPIARRLTRTPGLVPVAAALVGALLTLTADAVGHYLVANQPVGIITGIIGAPYLIYLLTRSGTWTRRT